MAIFPKYYKALASDNLRPMLGRAFVDKGRLIATNAHIMVYTKLDNLGLGKWSDELDGKLISMECLKEMSAGTVDEFEISNTHITIKYKRGKADKSFPFVGRRVSPVGNKCWMLRR